MKFMLIVHHNEETFQKIEKEKRQQMLAESIQLTHQLHAAGQYVHASPLQSAATAVMVRVRDGKPLVTDGQPPALSRGEQDGAAAHCRRHGRRLIVDGRGRFMQEILALH